MTNDTTIPPAMTAEEWAANAEGPMSGIVLTLADVTIPQRQLSRLIAVANAALSDNDPRKITQADIDALGRAASRIAEEYGVRGDWDAEFPHQAQEIRDLRALGQKLAALLPPE